MNQPVVALDLINRFINDLPFIEESGVLPSANYYINLPTSANDKYTYYNSSNGGVAYSESLPTSGVALGFLMGTVFSVLVATVVFASKNIGIKSDYTSINEASSIQMSGMHNTKDSDSLLRRSSHQYTAC